MCSLCCIDVWSGWLWFGTYQAILEMMWICVCESMCECSITGFKPLFVWLLFEILIEGLIRMLFCVVLLCFSGLKCIGYFGFSISRLCSSKQPAALSRLHVIARAKVCRLFLGWWLIGGLLFLWSRRQSCFVLFSILVFVYGVTM